VNVGNALTAAVNLTLLLLFVVSVISSDGEGGAEVGLTTDEAPSKRRIVLYRRDYEESRERRSEYRLVECLEGEREGKRAYLRFRCQNNRDSIH
jgi:hypothetical protein